MQGFTKSVPIDTDGTLVANLDTVVPSERAVKTYVASSLLNISTPYNAVINGDFNIWQRGTSFTATTGRYSADRFYLYSQGLSVLTGARDTSVPTVAQSNHLSNYSLKIGVNTIDASIGSTDEAVVFQVVEGYNWLPLAQRAFTLSFWVKAFKTGIYCIGLTNEVEDSCYVAEYTIAQSNTWQKVTISVPASPSAGSWNYTTGRGLTIYWVLAAGASYQTTANAWQSGSPYYATSNQVNGVDSTSNTLYLSQVQLEAGSVANPFASRQFGQEFALCQRYYQRWTQPPLRGTGNGAASAARMGMPLPVVMRVAPTSTLSGTVNVYDATTATPITALAASYNTVQTAEFDVNLSGIVALGRVVCVYQNGSGYIDFDSDF